MQKIEIFPITGIAEIRPGDDVAAEMVKNFDFRNDDIAVVTQKVVSKAEGRIVPAGEDDEDAYERAVLSEAKRILRQRGTLLITETHHGLICANAGVDRSNNQQGEISLLPVDPDRSAQWIRRRVKGLTGVDIAVIVSDTFGRAWRNGVTDVAIGSAGLDVIVNLKGTKDAGGRALVATEVCVADEITDAADLVKKKATSIPVAVVRGVDSSWITEGRRASEIIRSPEQDLFR
ncbi:MAG: coenzyme F420-0:L-glutamate ligase [Acidimicrobiaceae bacterium]|nr:coenzyme F420-0:L-glutamate ligase [Acidimicrobiaceae bacterium]